MSSPTVFYAESFAPWCERARWALDHHGIAYREVDQQPVLAEVTLRVAARRLGGRVTVPLLVDRPRVLMSSDEIARWAEERGHGAPLFPPAREREIGSWMEASEAIMVAGRAMLLPRILADADALAEALPPPVPRVFRPGLRFIARLGVHHLARKYGVRPAEVVVHDAASREALDRLRAALRDRRPHLLGDALTYADVTMAAALQFVRPVADAWIRLGPATRRAWTNPELAAHYPDLLDWRDALYRRERARRPCRPE